MYKGIKVFASSPSERGSIPFKVIPKAQDMVFVSDSFVVNSFEKAHFFSAVMCFLSIIMQF